MLFMSIAWSLQRHGSIQLGLLKGISLENETFFFSQAFNLSIGKKDK
jgi:hypothetical protein